MSVLSLSMARTPDAVAQNVDWGSASTAEQSLSSTDTKEALWAARAAANSSGDTVPVLTIGQGIPIVFCKRASSVGGCWVQPHAGLFRFSNTTTDGQQDVTIDYWLVISDGEIGSTSLPAWYGDVSISALTTSYNATSHAPGFTPANTIADLVTTFSQQTSASCQAGKSVNLSPQHETATVWNVTWSAQNGYEAGKPSNYSSASSGIPAGSVTFTASTAADEKVIRTYFISMNSGTSQAFQSQSDRSTYWKVEWNAQGYSSQVPSNYTSGTTNGTAEASRSNTFTAGTVKENVTESRQVSIGVNTSIVFSPANSGFKTWSCTWSYPTYPENADDLTIRPAGWLTTSTQPQTVTTGRPFATAVTYASASCQGDGGSVVVGMTNDKADVTAWSVDWTPNDAYKPTPSGALLTSTQTRTFTSNPFGDPAVTYTGLFTETYKKYEQVTYNGVITETFEVNKDVSFIGKVTEHYMVTPTVSYSAAIAEEWTETSEGPLAPLNCGTAGSYAGLSCARMTVHQYGDKVKPTVACNLFINNGVKVYNVKTGTTASSNQAPDLLYYLLVSVGKVNSALIDLQSFQDAVDFCTAQGFYFNGVLARSVNIREFIQRLSIYFLLNAAQDGGVWKLKPRLPVSAGAWDTSPITPSFTFTNDHIEDGSWKTVDYDFQSRRPIMAVMSYRSESGTAPPELKTVEVDNDGDGADGPFERFDMSEFCCSQAHAQTVGKYIVAQRKYATHMASFITSQVITDLSVGDFVRVVYARQDGTRFSVVDNYYTVTRLVRDAVGNTLVEADHLPTDSTGSSLVAQELAA